MSIYADIKSHKTKIAIIGLGYVGMPLAVSFGKTVKTIGFDLNKKRVLALQKNIDTNGEMSSAEMKKSSLLEFTSDPAKLREAKFIIVAVPTPITSSKQPDLYCMTSASETVGKNMSKGSIVVFESTVYPGVTEDICVPVLEKHSGLKYMKDFKVGYSPERINPGDKTHTIKNVIKVVSGCDSQTLEEVANVYSMVVKAGVHKASSIKCAEAAKVIENTQRDLNIALMNELSIIFHKMGIDTISVLEAAATKWNFINMRPGLVGGHCIGVDPYYLTFKAEELGYHPQVILAGRKINDNMGKYIAEQTIKHLIKADKTVKGAKVLIAGITFKENVSDIRNSRVIDIISELKEYGVKVIICDPLADKEEVKHEYGVELTDYNSNLKVDSVVIAVNHDIFKEKLTLSTLKKHLCGLRSGGSNKPSTIDHRPLTINGNGTKGVVIDVKGIFNPDLFKSSGLLYWRL